MWSQLQLGINPDLYIRQMSEQKSEPSLLNQGLMSEQASEPSLLNQGFVSGQKSDPFPLTQGLMSGQASAPFPITQGVMSGGNNFSTPTVDAFSPNRQTVDQGGFSNQVTTPEIQKVDNATLTKRAETGLQYEESAAENEASEGYIGLYKGGLADVKEAFPHVDFFDTPPSQWTPDQRSAYNFMLSYAETGDWWARSFDRNTEFDPSKHDFSGAFGIIGIDQPGSPSADSVIARYNAENGEDAFSSLSWKDQSSIMRDGHVGWTRADHHNLAGTLDNYDAEGFGGYDENATYSYAYGLEGNSNSGYQNLRPWDVEAREMSVAELREIYNRDANLKGTFGSEDDFLNYVAEMNHAGFGDIYGEEQSSNASQSYYQNPLAQDIFNRHASGDGSLQRQFDSVHGWTATNEFGDTFKWTGSQWMPYMAAYRPSTAGKIIKGIVAGGLGVATGQLGGLLGAAGGLGSAGSGAVSGALGSAVSGAVSGDGLDLGSIAAGALTGGLGGALNNPNGMLGGYINTGSELADDAIKGALVGGVGGAIKGDALGGALMGAGGGIVTNLAGQGMDYLSGDDSSEWDFASGPEWDESDLMNQDLALDLLQPIDVTAVRRELPEWAQYQADSDAFYDQYGNPQSFDGGYSDRFDAEYDAAVQNQLDSEAFDYINSDEFVGPSAGLAAGYDPNTVQGKWLDNLTQEDVIHSQLTFENSALSGYINDDRAFAVINTPDGYYLTDNNGNMVKYRGGDIGTVDLLGNNKQGTAMYDSLDPLSQHIAAGGQLPGTGQTYVDVDFEQIATEPQETEIPEETQTDNTEDSAESTPTNSTDKTEMGGDSNAGSDGNPSQDTGPSNPTIPSDYVLVGVDSNGERIYENVLTNIRIPESELPGEVYASNPQGDPESSNEPTTNPQEGATGTSEDAEDGGGQNADTDGGGGTNSGTDAGDGDSEGNDLGETGDNDGIGDDDDPGKGADDEGAGDPGIGSGSGGNGLGDGLGLLAGLGGGGNGENYKWQPIAGLTRLSPYQKRRHTIYNSLNEGLLKAALQQSRRA